MSGANEALKQQSKSSLRKVDSRASLGVKEDLKSTSQLNLGKNKHGKVDNRTHSLFPPGIPMGSQHKMKFVYDWDKTQGRERHVRDPIKKPMATPRDDMYLGAIKPASADVAWQHLDSDKKRPSLEDYNDTPEPEKRSRKPQHSVMDTQTDDGILSPTESLPIIRTPKSKPKPVKREPPPPPPKPKPVAKPKPKPRPQCPPPPDNPCCPCPCALPSSICCPPTQNMCYDIVPRCEPAVRVTRGSSDPSRRVSFSEYTTFVLPKTKPKSSATKKPAPPPRPESDSESEGDTEEEIQYDMAENDKDCAVIIEEPLNDEENEQVAREVSQPNNCNVAVVPPRSTAFQAPIIQLPCRPCGQQGHSCEEDGVNFSFYPRGNHATEITFTVEPKRPPVWQTMMKCGFVPIINCAVPPCALPEPSQQHGAYFVDEEYESSSSSSGSSSSSYTSSSSESSDEDSSSEESSEEEESKAPTQISQISTVYSEEEQTTVTVTTAPSLVVGPQLPPPPGAAGDAWKKSILKPPIKKQNLKKKESSSSSDDDDDDDAVA